MKYHTVHYLWQNYRGDPDNFNIFVISQKWERFRANKLQGIGSSCSSIAKMHEVKNSSDLIFTIYQYYTLALIFNGGLCKLLCHIQQACELSGVYDFFVKHVL